MSNVAVPVAINPASIFGNPARVDGSAPLDLDLIPAPAELGTIPRGGLSLAEFQASYPTNVAKPSLDGAIEGPATCQLCLDWMSIYTVIVPKIVPLLRFPQLPKAAAALAIQKATNDYGQGFTFRGVVYSPNGVWIPG